MQKPLIPLGRQDVGRPIEINMQESMNAMFFVLKTG